MDWKKLIVPVVCLVVGFGAGSGVFAGRGHRIATELERELATSRATVDRINAELAAAIDRERETQNDLERAEQHVARVERDYREITESIERAAKDLSESIGTVTTITDLVAAVRRAIDAVILTYRDTRTART